MTSVPHAGNTDDHLYMSEVASTGRYSTELWRFDTSTLGWEQVVNTTANGVGPSGRNSHVMTSVGLDLWMYGGYIYNYGEGDVYSTHTTPLMLLH
jgi:hypothetical protein